MADINWLEEAEAVIADINPFVEEISISSRQPDTDSMVLLNLKTYENEKFCVRLCASGFGVIGSDYDSESINEIKWFETPYAMLSEISKSYVNRFQHSLLEKLKHLENSWRVPNYLKGIYFINFLIIYEFSFTLAIKLLAPQIFFFTVHISS